MMHVSFRNWCGLEIDRTGVITDAKAAPQAAMMLLVKRDRLDVGDILSVDDDALREPPGALFTVTAGNLQALAGRLEARALVIRQVHPESAADLLTAAQFCRHALRESWVTSSVAVA